MPQSFEVYWETQHHRRIFVEVHFIFFPSNVAAAALIAAISKSIIISWGECSTLEGLWIRKTEL